MAKQREWTKIGAAWRIASEIRKVDEEQKEEGLKGRVAVMKQKRQIDRNGAFETVGHAKKALEARQEQRRERQNSAVARSSGEERRGGKMFGKKGSLLKPDSSKNGEVKKRDEQNGMPKGADREIKKETLDPGKGKVSATGTVNVAV